MIASSLFESTFAANPRSQEAWEGYRCEILEPGGSRDELEMITMFLGRAPSAYDLLQSFPETL